MGNRFIEKDKKKKNPIATAGIVDEEVLVENIEKEVIESNMVNVEEKINMESDKDTNEDEGKVVELKLIAKEEKQDMSDLFTIKKKVKVRKRQKNLWLKEENIDLLEKVSKNTDFNEGELVDLLIENFLRSLKIK